MSINVSDDIAKDVSSDGKQIGAKAVMLVFGKITGSIGNAFKTAAAENKLVTPAAKQTQSLQSLKNDGFDLVPTGERIPSFDRIANQHGIAYSVLADKSNPQNRMVCLMSKNGNIQPIGNALREYTQLVKLGKPSFQNRLALAQKQVAAQSITRDLSRNIKKSIAPKM